MPKGLKVERKRKQRQVQVVNGLANGFHLSDVAELTGVSPRTIARDIAELRRMGLDKDLIERERKAHIGMLPLATARLLSILMQGRETTAMWAIQGLNKGVGVWTDKVETTHKLDASDLQKQFASNMKVLLGVEIKADNRPQTTDNCPAVMVAEVVPIQQASVAFEPPLSVSVQCTKKRKRRHMRRSRLRRKVGGDPPPTPACA